MHPYPTIITTILTTILLNILPTNSQSIDGTLTLTLSNSIVQQSSDYTFNIIFVLNDPFVVGSVIQINFPAQYVSSSMATYACQLTNWPFVVSGAIQCTIANRVLKVVGAFPQLYEVLTDTIFQFIVRNITNPEYSGNTSPFDGSVIKPDLTQIVSISQQTLPISPGTLYAHLTVTPSIVSTISDLLITITTTHPLPANAKLRFYTATNTWQRANLISPDNIFVATPSCHSINNTLSNLYCQFTNSANQRTVTVHNINVYDGTASPTSTTFSFKISSIRTAPTTQPQGSFTLTILNSRSKSIDSSQNNKIGGLDPKQIMSPILTLSTYIVSQQATLTIQISINSIIETTDQLSIQLPNIISLSTLTRVIVQDTQIPTYTINNNIISFSGIQIVTSIPITIVLNDIVNPGYVVQVGSVSSGQVFRVWTSRSGYKIDYKAGLFTYVTIPGDINCTSITAGSTQAGITTTYTIPTKFQHPISRSTTIQIILPSDSFNLQQTTPNPPTCSTNLSPQCTLTILSNNHIKLSSIIASNNINNYYQLTITIYNIKNPINIGLFTQLQITSYNGGGQLVDRDDGIVGFVVTGRLIQASNVSISTNNGVVYGAAQITVVVNTNNPITVYTHLILHIPIGLDITGLTCTPLCQYQNSTPTHNTYQLDTSSYYLPNQKTTITLILTNIRNPKSTKPTNSFQIYIYNSISNGLLEYISSGLEYRLCTMPALLSVSVGRNSSRNGEEYVGYVFGVGLGFVYSGTQAVVASLEIPNSMVCHDCIVSSSNTSYYTTTLTISSAGTAIYLAPSTTLSISLTNHHSFQQKSLTIQILTSDQSYKIAKNTITLTNTLTNLINISYSFTPVSQQYLSSYTTFSVSSMNVTYGGFGYIDVYFGGEWDVSAGVLATGGSYWDMSVISGTMLRLTKKSTASNSTTADIFSISTIKTPTFTPSTADGSFYLETYPHTGNFKIDKTTSLITWQTTCPLPCRTCTSYSINSCASCYNDGLLVMSKILLFSSGGNSTCVSSCPQLFYLRIATNSCQPCSTSCGNCQLFSICTSCPISLPYILTLNQSSSTCYSTCPTSYYQSNQTLPYRCLQCSITTRNCLTCSNYLTCDSCQPSYYYHLQQCLPQCPNLTTVENQYSWTCQPCPINCTTCTRDSTTVGSFYILCLGCQAGYLLDRGRCYIGCITYGLVPDPTTGTCSSCHPTCLTCSLSTRNCTTCNTNSTFQYFLNNTCNPSCPAGYYPNNILYICVRCTGPCQYCTTSSISSCLSCIYGYTLYNSTCRNNCPEGFYQNGSQCVGCPVSCITCSASTVCMSCADGYSLQAGRECRIGCPDGYVSINRVCLQCSSNCRTCSLVNFCTSCFTSMYLYQGLCTDPCPTKYYKSTTTCEQCPYQCSQCLTPTICQSCISGYQLTTNTPNSNISCNSLCQQGYVPINGICQQCSTGCQACTYTRDNCSTCVGGYYFYENVGSGSLRVLSNICYMFCPISLFKYQPLSRCYTTCPTTTFINLTYSTNTSTLLQKQCIDCPILCSTCTNLTTCLTCKSGASILNNTCYSSCPILYPYSIGGICVSCNIVQCYQCSGVTCVQCRSGYLLILADGVNSCIGSCGTNMIYNMTQRKCQLITNNTNTNTTNTTTNTTANTTNTTTSIQFIPLPYCIISVVSIIIVLALHWIQYIQIYVSLFGVFGILLQLSLYTCIGVLATKIYTQISNSIISSRLLAQIVFGSQVMHKIEVVFVVMGGIMVVVNFVCGGLYWWRVRIRRYRVVGVCAFVLGCKVLGGLLCSGFYGVNMKDIRIKQDKQDKQNKSSQKNKRDGKQQQKVQEKYINVGKSNYAQSATTKQLNTSKNFNPLDYKPTKNNKHSTKKLSEQVKSKNQDEILQQNLIVNNQIIVIGGDDNVEQGSKKSNVKGQEMLLQVNQVNQDLEDMKIQENQKRSSNKQVQRQSKKQLMKEQISNKQPGKYSNKIPSIEQRKITDPKSVHTPSLNSSYYKPSQIHSVPNPKLNPNYQPPITIQQQYIQNPNQQSSPSLQNLQQNNPTKIQHSLQQIKNQYHNFWLIYDRIILIYIPIDLILVVCGIVLCFNSQSSTYQFFGGIQIAVLGIFDLILTALWRIWNHQASQYTPPRKNSNKYRIRYEQDYTMSSALSKQKILQPEQSQSIQNLQQNLNPQPPQHQNYSISYTQQKKHTKTQINHPIPLTPQKLQSEQKDYKSEYARPIDVIKLKNQQIQQALKQGVYRHNKNKLAQKQHQLDQQSKLDSAEKFNKISQQQKNGQSKEQILFNNLDLSSKDRTNNKDSKNKASNKLTNKLLEENDGRQQQQEQKIEDKQVAEIIFENYDEQSLDTRMGQNQQQDTSIRNSNKKRKDSLGSQKQPKNKSKLMQIIPIVQQTNNQPSKITQSPPSRQYTPVQIQQLQTSIITHRKNPYQLATSKIQNIPSKQYTNIFENDHIQEEQNDDSFIQHQSRQRNRNQNSEELQIVDLKNVYRKKINQTSNPVSTLGRYSNDRSLEKKKQTKVIYADLDSVGTVSEYDVREDGDRFQEVDQEMQVNYKTIENINKNNNNNNVLRLYGESFEINDDTERPSNFINTNFTYYKPGAGGSSAMPQKLKVSRPKKLPKKSTNTNNK